MNYILNQYKVAFSLSIGYAKPNSINTLNDWLSLFIEDFYNISDVSRLLTGLNDIITDDDTVGGPFDTQSMYLAMINSYTTDIYSDMDKYYDNSQISPDYTLPTPDFQTIVQAWRNYLVYSATPPNN